MAVPGHWRAAHGARHHLADLRAALRLLLVRPLVSGKLSGACRACTQALGVVAGLGFHAHAAICAALRAAPKQRPTGASVLGVQPLIIIECIKEVMQESTCRCTEP